VATARIKAVLQFDFDGTDEHYRVVIDCGAARLMRDTSADPDLRVSCTAAVWAGIARGDLNPRDALRQGLVTLAGDRSLFARLSRFFPVVG
jgi:putative sterol carrier protein